jgi:hypothetical protein
MPSFVKPYAVSLIATALLISGCGGTPGSIAAQGALAQIGAPPVQTNQRGSWMLAEAKRKDLLYLADGVASIDVLTYPGYKRVGVLGGFSEVVGVCTDKRGNVWVPNSARFTLVEYLHGGTTPIATLYDPNEYTVACAVDPLSGDLAVYTLPVAGPGPAIAIFPHESGNPVSYTVPGMSLLSDISYGPRSQLFFDGTTPGNAFEMQRFYAGKFNLIRIRGAKVTSAAGGVQFAEGAVTINVIGNGNTSLIYRMSSSGVVQGTTQLLNSYSCQGYLIWKKVLICPSGLGPLQVYPYPQGGNYAMQIPLQSTTQAAMSVAAPQ